VPQDVMDKWLKSKKFAQVNGVKLKPVKNPIYPDIALSTQKGQSEAFCCVCEAGEQLIVKKFNNGKELNTDYLNSVSALLPRHEAFRAGTNRQILSATMVKRASGYYYTAELSKCLDGTILMPRIDGLDWASVAEEIRQDRIPLDKNMRVKFAINLADLVAILEAHGCCHRDISSGNVFIILTSGMIYLIDFDSLYHPCLTIPKATTCGTAGYSPPFAWGIDGLDAKRTWCPYADRYAMAIIIVEFLTLDKGSPLTAEGGMFSQDELCARRGKSLENIRKLLVRNYPQIVQLFDSVINSRDFQTCPSPQDWQQSLEKIFLADDIKPPALNCIKDDYKECFQKIISKVRPAAPLWPAPRLSDIPPINLELPKVSSFRITLPPDPWKTGRL